MDRNGRIPRRHVGPLLVMVCGGLAIVIVVLAVLWISHDSYNGLEAAGPPSVAQGAR